MQTRQRAAAYFCCRLLAGYFWVVAVYANGPCRISHYVMAYPNFSATTFPNVVFPLPDGPIIMIPVDLFTSRFIFFSAHSPQSFQSRYSYHSVSIFLNPDDPVPIPRQGHRIIPIIGNQPDLVADDSFCHFGSSPQTFIDFIFYSVGSVSAVTASPSSFALRRSLPHSGVKNNRAWPPGPRHS